MFNPLSKSAVTMAISRGTGVASHTTMVKTYLLSKFNIQASECFLFLGVLFGVGLKGNQKENPVPQKRHTPAFWGEIGGPES